MLDPDVTVELNKTGLWGEPRPFSKAALQRKVKVGPSSPQITTNMGSARFAPLALKEAQGDSKGATLRKPRGVLCPQYLAPGNPRRRHSWGKYPLGKTQGVFLRPGQFYRGYHHTGWEIRSS